MLQERLEKRIAELRASEVELAKNLSLVRTVLAEMLALQEEPPELTGEPLGEQAA